MNSGSQTEIKWEDNSFLRKKVILLQKQVEELSSLLRQEEETFDDCNICFSREINTVFLECGHRVMCHGGAPGRRVRSRRSGKSDGLPHSVP